MYNRLFSTISLIAASVAADDINGQRQLKVNDNLQAAINAGLMPNMGIGPQLCRNDIPGCQYYKKIVFDNEADEEEDEDREEISAKKNDKISVQVKKGYMDCQYWQRDNTFKVLDPIDYLDQKEFDRND